ncbi:MAG: tyrosine--tRNA ligase [Planctomycetota bacterium]|nr:tyrosine--tRNA ligase [Planctomycetota bacterium]
MASSTLDPRVAAQMAVFRRGTVDLIEAPELEARIASSLATGKPLRVKFGMDPTSADLHVGHAVQLLKLRAIQELGHQIVLIVGDATAMVGDPSGRNKLRPPLSRADIDKNLATYVDQAGKVLDMSRTEVRRNSEWFDAMRFEDVLRLLGRATVARMLERDTFEKRMAEREPIGVHELLYPLMQGWDSVMIRCDLELGGTDQLFNLLRGRDLQAQEGQVGQVCFTMPLVNGGDGRKMSKSYGNAIGFLEPPFDMFQKVVKTVPDTALADWFLLLTRVPEAEVAALLAGDHRAAQLRLAREITGFFHGPAGATSARDEYERRARGEGPGDVEERRWPAEHAGKALPLANLLAAVKLANTNSDARRLVQQNAVKVNGLVVADPVAAYSEADLPLLVQTGKARFARIVR